MQYTVLVNLEVLVCLNVLESLLVLKSPIVLVSLLAMFNTNLDQMYKVHIVTGTKCYSGRSKWVKMSLWT